MNQLVSERTTEHEKITVINGDKTSVTTVLHSHGPGNECDCLYMLLAQKVTPVSVEDRIVRNDSDGYTPEEWTALMACKTSEDTAKIQFHNK